MNHGLFLNEKIKEVIAELAEVAGFLWEKGWAERNAGNISVNITGLISSSSYHFDEAPVIPLEKEYPGLDKNVFLVTATGTRMRDLARDPEQGLSLLQMTGNGKSYKVAELHRKQKSFPTSELPTHLLVQEMLKRTNPGMKVLIHAHVPEFIALTHIGEFKSEEGLNRMLLSMHPEIKMFIPQGTGFVPYSVPGTTSIAKETVRVLENHHIAVWEKHGVLATGSSVHETFDTIDLLAKAAKIFFLCRNAGYSPEGLTEQQVNDIPEA